MTQMTKRKPMHKRRRILLSDLGVDSRRNPADVVISRADLRQTMRVSPTCVGSYQDN